MEGPAPSFHELRLRVRYSDTDALGVVYYASYLAYFEAARVELLRAFGLEYRTLEERGVAVPVVEVVCRYRAPARFDDLLIVRTELSQVKRASFVFRYGVVREPDHAVIAEGHTVHACVDKTTLRPVAVPASVREKLKRLGPS